MTAISPRQFAEERGFSERAVRKKARELGSCRILGKTMVFEEEDVKALLEALGVNYDAPPARAVVYTRPRQPDIPAIGSGKGYVYFLQSDSRVKIGFARNVAKRIAGIACTCPFPVKLLATERGSMRKEQELHKRFASARVHGEWFDLSSEIEAYIAGLK